jgi:hypothetical protein
MKNLLPKNALAPNQSASNFTVNALLMVKFADLTVAAKIAVTMRNQLMLSTRQEKISKREIPLPSRLRLLRTT